MTLPVKTILKKDAKLPCPRCDNHLQSKVVDSNLIDYCADCGGVWLGHHLFDDLLSDAPPNSIGALGKPPSGEIKKLPRHKVRYLRCPECDVTMSRHNFMNNSNIILDQCNQHGVWFDKHELAVSLEHVRSSQKEPQTEKTADIEKKQISRRDDSEVFEIKDEDLHSLLEEFPHWVRKQ